MKILSIDVGIKNLAFCLFDVDCSTSQQLNILQWNVVNLTDDGTLKPCSVCNKPAKFKKNDTCFCNKHAKAHTQYLIPTAQQKWSVIAKQKLASLHEMAETFKLSYDPKIKKTDLVTLIQEHIQETCFEVIETTKSNDMNLYTIGQQLKRHFNELFKEVDRIEHVIIENQIGPLAIRMKTIQGMLVQYFVMSHLNVEHIEFISAANKLKDCDIQEKENYKDRKKMGIHKCLGILEKDSRLKEHCAFFNSHKKKDDLSDSFLQGIWYIDSRKLF